ncbi:MAG: hypothetical protein EXR86_15140 [Gammaproteobacteria bacterium]|nr:hypothetical protein [Gammaproteobacteria bacterium]
MEVTPRILLLAGVLSHTGLVAAEAISVPKLGVTPTAEILAQHQNLVFPDGTGLPPGSGTVAEGKILFESQCVEFHGVAGRGGSGGELAGGNPDLTAPQPDKNIGTYWPRVCENDRQRILTMRS